VVRFLSSLSSALLIFGPLRGRNAVFVAAADWVMSTPFSFEYRLHGAYWPGHYVRASGLAGIGRSSSGWYFDPTSKANCSPADHEERSCARNWVLREHECQRCRERGMNRRHVMGHLETAAHMSLSVTSEKVRIKTEDLMALGSARPDFRMNSSRLRSHPLPCYSAKGGAPSLVFGNGTARLGIDEDLSASGEGVEVLP